MSFLKSEFDCILRKWLGSDGRPCVVHWLCICVQPASICCLTKPILPAGQFCFPVGIILPSFPLGLHPGGIYLSVGHNKWVLWRCSGSPVTFRVCVNVRLMRVGSKRWVGYHGWLSSHNTQLRSSIQRLKSQKWECCYGEDLVFGFYPWMKLGEGILKNKERSRKLCILGEEIAMHGQ